MKGGKSRDAVFDQAVALHRAGRTVEAEAAYRRILKLRPRHGNTLANLAVILRRSGRREEARQVLERAVAAEPRNGSAWTNLGTVLLDLGLKSEAVDASAKAVECEPDSYVAHGNLGWALWNSNRFDEARASLERALELNPRDALAWNNLGNVHQRQCRVEESLECYRKAIECDPQLRMAVSNIAFNMHFLDRFTPEEIFQAHRDFGTRYEDPLLPSALPPVPVDPNKAVLRVGFMSPDFRDHPVAAFLLPLLSNWLDAHFELALYSEATAQDDYTRWFRERAKIWCETSGLNDRQLAERIRADGVDILIDLCGHTGGSRLLVMAHKPAPVQVSWLGYFDTSGLRSVDYIISDPVCIRPGEENRYTEVVVRLPNDFACYRPPSSAPDIGPLPFDRTGQFTFGSQNQLVKMTARSIALWSRIVNAVPGSRLLLAGKALNDESTRQRFASDFAAAGLDPARLVLRSGTNQRGVLQAYNEIDLALDPYPCAGGTTTCESMYMGVPVVSLYGTRFGGRHSASHLRAAGIPEFIQPDEESYFNKAVSLARDPARLRELRAGLRAQMLASPMCDGALFARHFSEGLRAMWKHQAGRRAAPATAAGSSPPPG